MWPQVALALAVLAAEPDAPANRTTTGLPDRVLRQTRYYGTVTVDHRAHVARRAPCRTCHGDGPVAKVTFPSPRVAHERCVSCHREVRAGPVACRECHVKGEPAAGAR